MCIEIQSALLGAIKPYLANPVGQMTPVKKQASNHQEDVGFKGFNAVVVD